jgi:hypothetical protein
LEYIYHLSGIFSVILFMVGIHFKSNEKLKKVMIFNALLKSINMFFNQQYSGMIVNIINFFRNILSLKSLDMKKSKHYYVLFFALFYILIQYFLKDNYWYLPIIGSTLGLISLFYLKNVRMRLCLLSGSSVWLVYAVLHGNIYGVILGSLTIVSFFSSFVFNGFNYNE